GLVVPFTAVRWSPGGDGADGNQFGNQFRRSVHQRRARHAADGSHAGPLARGAGVRHQAM
ncbi:MAG TPA: hypothetical protein VMR14_04390, partial [Streptosporangiaceae bacterium]|nr:hypothetical protein [Streptosporangiaceae bacterium]